MKRVLVLAPLALMALAMAGCASGGSGATSFDPVTCQIRNPKPGQPPFDVDCLAAAQASERASKEAAQRDAARGKKK